MLCWLLRAGVGGEELTFNGHRVSALQDDDSLELDCKVYDIVAVFNV